MFGRLFNGLWSRWPVAAKRDRVFPDCNGSVEKSEKTNYLLWQRLYFFIPTGKLIHQVHVIILTFNNRKQTVWIDLDHLPVSSYCYRMHSCSISCTSLYSEGLPKISTYCAYLILGSHFHQTLMRQSSEMFTILSWLVFLQSLALLWRQLTDVVLYDGNVIPHGAKFRSERGHILMLFANKKLNKKRGSYGFNLKY